MFICIYSKYIVLLEGSITAHSYCRSGVLWRFLKLNQKLPNFNTDNPISANIVTSTYVPLRKLYSSPSSPQLMFFFRPVPKNRLWTSHIANKVPFFPVAHELTMTLKIMFECNLYEQ